MRPRLPIQDPIPDQPDNHHQIDAAACQNQPIERVGKAVPPTTRLIGGWSIIPFHDYRLPIRHSWNKKAHGFACSAREACLWYSRSDYFPLNSKSAVADLPLPTSTLIFFSPRVPCHAFTVYLPGGILSIV
uniref:Uncharacterized protein n=1 Tax=Candidatus Kentrum sp. LFY TaxID=2126342 RepID=A0A450UK47_9GAMM|nr:MAG: hypothetical protein BECKLFY1418B_GA0070995_104015 [Candidatus Kentron sp. LFY]